MCCYRPDYGLLCSRGQSNLIMRKSGIIACCAVLTPTFGRAVLPLERLWFWCSGVPGDYGAEGRPAKGAGDATRRVEWEAEPPRQCVARQSPAMRWKTIC
jgi:hypothetical protein